MRLLIENIEASPLTLLRRVGYTFKRSEGEEMSFVRELARGGYPRFHVYTKLSKNNLTLNLHLDQKKHTYGEATRHHGEYENDGAVKEEVARLLSLFGKTCRII